MIETMSLQARSAHQADMYCVRRHEQRAQLAGWGQLGHACGTSLAHQAGVQLFLHFACCQLINVTLRTLRSTLANGVSTVKYNWVQYASVCNSPMLRCLAGHNALCL